MYARDRPENVEFCALFTCSSLSSVTTKVYCGLSRMLKSLSYVEFRPLTVSIGGALILAGLLPPGHSLRQADKTAHAQIRRGTFPFPLVIFPDLKRRLLVRVVDVESTLARLAERVVDVAPKVIAPAPMKRGRGRPRKVARQVEVGR